MMSIRPVLFALIALGLTAAACSSGSRLPEDCPIRHQGICYQDTSSACAAAGCPDDCTILRSYPGQVACGDE